MIETSQAYCWEGHRLFISVKVEGIESRSPAVAEVPLCGPST